MLYNDTYFILFNKHITNYKHTWSPPVEYSGWFLSGNGRYINLIYKIYVIYDTNM